MTANNTEPEKHIKASLASSSGALIAPKKLEFDTMQSIDLTAGFRAPPTSPCNTFVGGSGMGMTNMLSNLRIENCSLPHITPEDLMTQNELIKQRKRGRKSAPHVSTLFANPIKEKNVQNEGEEEKTEADNSFASSSSSIPPSSSLFGGAGNYPPPNSPENPISCSMIDSQNVSLLANLSFNSQEEQPESSSSSSNCCSSKSGKGLSTFPIENSIASYSQIRANSSNVRFKSWYRVMLTSN